jgi:hypothetical protein
VRRIDAQWPMEKKRKLADFIIDNSIKKSIRVTPASHSPPRVVAGHAWTDDTFLHSLHDRMIGTNGMNHALASTNDNDLTMAKNLSELDLFIVKECRKILLQHYPSRSWLAKIEWVSAILPIPILFIYFVKKYSSQ